MYKEIDKYVGKNLVIRNESTSLELDNPSP